MPKRREEASVAWPIVGVLWVLSCSASFFTGIAFVGASFPDVARALFAVSLASFAASTIIGVGRALATTVEKESDID